MKKLIFLILTYTILFSNPVYSQAPELKGNCSSVWLDLVLPRIPGFILPIDATLPFGNCSEEVNLYHRGLYFVDLQKKDNLGNFTSVSGGPHGYPDDYANWYNNNLSPGTYRMRVDVIEQVSCTNSYVKAYKDSDELGWLGNLGNGDYTNEVVVGAPAQSDNSVTFLNGNGVYLFNDSSLDRYFDINEPIRIDASACKNFNEYQINIQEFWYGNPSLPHRFKNCVSWSNPANRPLGIENLSELWNPNNDPNWVMIPGNAYRLQVTIRNSNCTSWVDNLQFFYICNNPNWSCRTGFDHAKEEPTISPNPVSNVFSMGGITFNPLSLWKEELAIHDLTGRLVKKFTNIKGNDFDVSDLMTGAYFVSVVKDNKKIFTKKLIISR